MSKTYVEKVPISRRIWSFITAVATSLSFMTAGFAGVPTVIAEPIGYTVNFEYLDHDKTSPLSTEDDAYQVATGYDEGSLLDGNHYVLAVAKGHNEDWTTYALKPINNATSLTFDRSEFRIDNDDGTNGYNWGGHYDPQNSYNMSSVRILRVKEGKTFNYGWGGYDPNSTYHNISLKDLIEYFDDSQSFAPPTGFQFTNGTINNQNATLRMYKSVYDTIFKAQITFDSEGKAITESDRIYLLVHIEHQTTGHSYYLE
ncbi:MAG: hypothetical protein II936_09945, partial [Oscillospiraceae bacterium]|nr:hypothetical protein [Oscillospiraceae bacterium]